MSMWRSGWLSWRRELWDGCVTLRRYIFSSFGYLYFQIQYMTQKHPTNEGDARHDDTGVR